MRQLCVFLFLLLFAGCAAHPPVGPMGGEGVPEGVKRLAEDHWINGQGVYTLKQAVVLQVGERSLQMDGIIRIDLDKKVARLVILGGFGMKWFDMGVTPTAHVVHFVLPAARQLPRFLDHAAQAVQRLYLTYQPAVDSKGVYMDGDSLVAIGEEGEAKFTFDSSGKIQRTEFIGESEKWNVSYDYSGQPDTPVPNTVTLADHGADYRLILRTTSVRYDR
nr:DUF3261 domain-containing protein [Pseudodesulfovibrio sp.]